MNEQGGGQLQELAAADAFGAWGKPRDDWSIWNNSIGYGFVGKGFEFFTDEQNRRYEAIRVARMLWKGHHRRAFLLEGRSQFDFTPMRVGDRIIQPYVTLNVLKLISTTLTDLLLGSEPLLTVEDEVAQNDLDELSHRSDLHRVFYDATREASWARESLVEIVRWADQVYIQNMPPDEVYPLGNRNPDGQYSMYRRFALASSDEKKPRPLLLETTFTPAAKLRACFFLDGTKRIGSADLSLWPVKNPDGSPLLDNEPTGLDAPSIIWMGNELDEGQPTSDYDGLIELQDELNHKQTQIARVIAKHSDPKLFVSDSSVDPSTGGIRASADVFFGRSKEDMPAYITWNAELASAMADRDFTLNATCIAAELSQGLLGLEKGGAPDSARKLRLQATKSLARKDRKASSVRPFIRTAIDTAIATQQRSRYVAVAMNGVGLELRDGLPVDELDQANTLTTLTGGKPVLSVKGASQRLFPDAQASDENIKELEEERAAATPSVFMQQPPVQDRGGTEPGEETAPAPEERGEVTT